MVRQHNKGGFSLIEIIVVISVLAIIVGLAVPNFGGMDEAAAAQRAVDYAQAINIAKASYDLEIPTAEASWDATVNDADRYLDIRGYMSNAPADYTALNEEIAPYTIVLLGVALDERVIVNDGNGNPIAY